MKKTAIDCEKDHCARKRQKRDPVANWIKSTNSAFLERQVEEKMPAEVEEPSPMEPADVVQAAPVVLPMVAQHPIAHQSRYVNNMFFHLSFRTNTGAILQFVTNQCNDAPGIIGAIRLPVSDPLDIGGYITENWISLKEIARSHLDDHMRRCNHHVGWGEHLALEDYSFGTTVATVSAAARAMNPYGRLEAGMWTLLTPTLLDPVRVDIVENGRRLESWQYVLNGFIHLNECGRRATHLARSAQQEPARPDFEQGGRRNNEYSPYPARGGRGGYRGRPGSDRGGPGSQGHDVRRSNTINEQIRMAIQENLQKTAFPATPVPTQPIQWPNNGVPTVPPARK